MPQPLNSSIITERSKFLSFGEMGSGKTFASGTMPGRIYVLCIGGGNEIITLLSPTFTEKHPEKKGMINWDSVKENLGKRGSFADAKGYDAACDLLDEALELDKSGETPFDSLVVDGSTGLRGFAMNKSMEITFATAKSSEKTSLAKFKQHGIVTPRDNDYFGEQSLVWKFVNWCFSLDKHFNLITHVWKETKADRATRETTVISRQPAFTGKQRDSIPTLFDNSWYFEKVGKGRSVYYQAMTQGDDVTIARTRFGGVLPDYYKNVDYSDAIKQFTQAAA